MAFVNATPVTASVRPASSLRPHVTSLPRTSSVVNSSTTIRMGYGDYSYITDQTTGQVQRPYVNHLGSPGGRLKGLMASVSSDTFGGSSKGKIDIPKEGIPQLEDSELIPIDNNAPPDPRLAETEGKLYPWDPNHPKSESENDSTLSKMEEDEAARKAMSQFRSSMASERSAALSAYQQGTTARVERIKGGLDETYKLTMDGQLELKYARVEGIIDAGGPASGSVGALDNFDMGRNSIVVSI